MTAQYKQLKINEFVSFDETCHPPSREHNTPTRERDITSRESNRSSRGSSRNTNPPSREGVLFPEIRKRAQSVYSQRQSIKPLNMQSIIEAQKRISLNPTYMLCKKLDKIALEEKLNEKVKLTKACHRPVTVPLVKIIGKIPEYVDVSELQGLRREVSIYKLYVNYLLNASQSSLKNYKRIIIKLWRPDDIMFIEGMWN